MNVRRRTDGHGLGRWVPGLAEARRYRREWLGADVVAGLVLTALLIPQGMAYAELAGLPAVTGLYTTIASLAGYALFGPSRILVLGPDSSLAPVIAAIIAPLVVADGPDEAIVLAGMIAVLAGLIELAAGALRLGSVTDLLSMPVRVGYLNGLAIIVLVSQLPKLFGFEADGDGVVDEAVEFVTGVVDGRTHVPALVLGAASIVVMVLGRRWAPRVPWVLVAAVVSVAVVGALGYGGEELDRVGPLPSGLPAPSIPWVSWADLGPLLIGSLAVAAVSMADTAALSRSFSAQRGERVDQNREAIGLGAANVMCGLFGGFPTSGSTSRTAVASAIGSRTQLAGAISAVLIVMVLIGAGGALSDLPSSVLAAIVIVASFALFDVRTPLWLARVRRTDALALVIAMLGVVLIGVLEGIAIAIITSVVVFVWKRWRPYTAVLGRVRGRKGYHDVERHPDAYRIPGLLLFRFDAPLFFANAPYFETAILEAIREQPEPIRRVVIAAEAITDVDSTGNEVLGQVLDELRAQGIELAFAELKGPVKDRLHRYGLYQRIGDRLVFPTIGTAVWSYARETGVEARPADA